MRGKIKLAWIKNDAARKTSFRKRSAGLMQKIKEICVLTDVKACAIVFDSDGTSLSYWPEKEALEQVTSGFSDVPEINQQKFMSSVESYLEDKITKMAEQLENMRKAAREMEMNQLMLQLSRDKSIGKLSYKETHELLHFIEIKMKND